MDGRTGVDRPEAIVSLPTLVKRFSAVFDSKTW